MHSEKIELIAQKISFAFEDHYYDHVKREQFLELFAKYFPIVDSEEVIEPYDAIVMLGRKDALRFESMVNEMRDLSLIFD
jgi:hypothetical protein